MEDKLIRLRERSCDGMLEMSCDQYADVFSDRSVGEVMVVDNCSDIE